MGKIYWCCLCRWSLTHQNVTTGWKKTIKCRRIASRVYYWWKISFYLNDESTIIYYSDFLLIAGSLCLLLGTLGLFLPVLPTTPFWLLTAWCYTKASPKLYQRMMKVPIFGNCIRNYRLYHAISIKNKIISISTLWITILLSIYLVNKLWITTLLLIVAIGVTCHLLLFKTLKK